MKEIKYSIFLSGLIASGAILAEGSDKINVTFTADTSLSAEQLIRILDPDSDTYCQNSGNHNKLTEEFKFYNGEDTHSFDLNTNQLFCVSINENETTHYYGPYTASHQCIAEVKSFITRSEAHLQPPANVCMSTTKYTTLSITSTANPAGNEATHYEAKVMQKGNDNLCQSTVDNANIYINDLLFSDPINNEYIYYDFRFGVLHDENFCVWLTNQDPTNYVLRGPFREAHGCEINYVEDKGLYANHTCTGDNMISFENIKYASDAETQTYVTIYASTSTTKCKKTEIDEFGFWPNQIQNVMINSIPEISPAIRPFCVIASKGNDSTAEYGPFLARSGCKLTVDGNGRNLVTPNELC